MDMMLLDSERQHLEGRLHELEAEQCNDMWREKEIRHLETGADSQPHGEE